VRLVDGDAPTMRVAAVRLPTRYLAPAVAEFLAVLENAAKRRVESWSDWGDGRATVREVA
jgi:hypothetical protein